MVPSGSSWAGAAVTPVSMHRGGRTLVMTGPGVGLSSENGLEIGTFELTPLEPHPAPSSAKERFAGVERAFRAKGNSRGCRRVPAR